MKTPNRQYDSVCSPDSMPVPDGAPTWVTQELIADTVKTWQPYYEAQLTVDDALAILLSVARLFDALE